MQIKLVHLDKPTLLRQSYDRLLINYERRACLTILFIWSIKQNFLVHILSSHLHIHWVMQFYEIYDW